jgi:hypothetical protein
MASRDVYLAILVYKDRSQRGSVTQVALYDVDTIRFLNCQANHLLFNGVHVARFQVRVVQNVKTQEGNWKAEPDLAETCDTRA